MANLFSEALDLIDSKSQFDMTEEEKATVGAAMIPLMVLPRYKDTPIGEGLKELSKIIEENEALGGLWAGGSGKLNGLPGSADE